MNNLKKKGLISMIVGLVFPQPVDFFTLLNSQCQVMVETLTLFDRFMTNQESSLGAEVLRLEHVADDLKHANMDQLNKTFATPIDRDDIIRAIVSIDDLIGYAKTTVREIELLKVIPDDPMQEMSRLILHGGLELQEGYQKLKAGAIEGESHAFRAHKTERAVEKVYRRAVSELLDEQRYLNSIQNQSSPDLNFAITEVFGVLRRRELYRHLSNAADRVETAAEVLHDIIVKIA